MPSHIPRCSAMVRASLLMAVLAVAMAAEPIGSWTWTNHTGRSWTRTPLRLPIAGIAVGTTYRVQQGGTEVPCQVEALPGGGAVLWILADVERDASVTWTVAVGGTAKPGGCSIQADRIGPVPVAVLSSGGMRIAVPTTAAPGATPPAPIAGVRDGEGPWRAVAGGWTTTRRLTGFTCDQEAGPVFARATVRYAWDGVAGADGKEAATSMVQVTVLADQPTQAWIVERHAMGRSESWWCDLASGWNPTRSLFSQHGGGPSVPGDDALRTGTLLPGQTRLGDDLVHLVPRWSQAFDDGWCFAAADEGRLLGAIAVRAGAWVWPYDNQIRCRLKPAGGSAALVLPTWHGGRTWLLQSEAVSLWNKERLYAHLHQTAWTPLDTVVHRWWTQWDGVGGGLAAIDRVGSAINPTSQWRQLTKGAAKEMGKPGDRGTLTAVQQWLDSDYYGDYWTYSSPENPNFHTDVLKRAILSLPRLKGHPQFRELCAIAEHALRTDLYHSVTMPGGAGNECPGYQAYAGGMWQEMAAVCKEHLGFDPTTWDRYRAARSFQWRLSQPDGNIRRQHPGGDTHPGKRGPGGDGTKDMAEYADGTAPTAFVTEELPGFGCVLRDRPGTPDETYVAFKSGPNRGHYHGDQLSLHWCVRAAPLAVDHHCSYSPRAGQEHMHNRVSFSVVSMPYANMDGYERLIAFQPGAIADIAVGQVESDRLRPCTPLPPEEWDVIGPVVSLAGAQRPGLTSRRTVVLMKGGPVPYLVLRDQYSSGVAVVPTFNLHVLGDVTASAGRVVRYGDSLTIWSAGSVEPTYAALPWQHENGGLEKTVAARLSLPSSTSGEFITVLFPSGKIPTIAAIPGGVQVGDDVIRFAGTIDEAAKAAVTITRAGKDVAALLGSAIDLDRSQGEVGLFVPDAGYPFGDIPDWLIRQRANPPAWRTEWVRQRPWPTALPAGAER